MTYAPATATDLKARFPAFSGVADATIEYWLADARETVTDAWIESDRAPGEMELAAHSMAVLGIERPAGDAVGGLAQMGVTAFKSASMSVNFDAETIQNQNSGGYGASKYGQMFLTRLRRNVAGPRLVRR